MEVQVLSPSPAVDFNYDSTSTSPYATAPSSPQSSIPFTWEEKPGIPKQDNNNNYNYLADEDESSVDTEFAFGYLERHSISAADELFDGGKIKPLKPPPRLHFSNTNNDSPVSPKSPKLRFKELSLSPRNKKNDFDPFSEALKQTQNDHIHTLQKRGREKTVETTKRRNTKVSRSLSPLNYYSRKNNNNNTTTMEQTSSSSSPTWYNKWNLKNLLLFRSASEGSVTSARKQGDSKKYTLLKKNNNNNNDQTTSFSFRSTDSSGSSSVQVSADNDDFSTTNEGTKNKKTSTGSTNLSYKSAGLMGCLRFNQNAGSVHEISRGINSVMKG
uniref:putative uncharacterized protein DDB_G0290989 n=1 Tax=Erigeron canadensis TaxID=72917 RepID=UPI001CB96640|nr:putative uncharacterized protein DDB_G0290989 [Erigeron canadensis]